MFKKLYKIDYNNLHIDLKGGDEDSSVILPNYKWFYYKDFPRIAIIDILSEEQNTLVEQAYNNQNNDIDVGYKEHNGNLYKVDFHDITLDFPYEKMIIENDNEIINDIIINFMIRIDINIYDNDNKKIDFISRHLESTGGINRSRICVGNNFDLGNSGINAN